MLSPEDAGVFVAPMLDMATGERHWLVTSLSSLGMLNVPNVIVPGQVAEAFTNALIMAMAQEFIDERGNLPTPCYTSVN